MIEGVSVEENKEENTKDETPAQNFKCQYIRRFYLLLNTLFILADHVADIILITKLFQMQQYWFAAIYLAVDIFPAAVIIWKKYSTERNWKVLVSVDFILDSYIFLFKM